MGKEVDLAINGDFHRGFAVNLKIRQHGDYIAGDIGKLPPYPELREHYNHWQALYRNLDEVLKTLPLKRNAIPTNSSDALPACQKAADLLTEKFQWWLRSAEFSPIETKFRNTLSPEEEIWVLLETDNPQLLRFPWNLWGLRADFPKTEIGIASPSFRAVGNPSAPKDKVRILAILGDEIGSADVEALARVPDCEVTWLSQPQLEELDSPLWEEQWDILFFGGHSKSLDDDRKGKIQLSEEVWLSISDLRIHLQKAIGQGLQLAIFNSCDGLGLAYQLAAGEDLHLPYTIVMRENLPKQLAPKWLDYFVQEFTGGKSLPGAVGEARKRLQSLEANFPCASWLPVICQNPAATPLTWEKLRGCSGDSTSSDDPKPVNWLNQMILSVGIKKILLGMTMVGITLSFTTNINIIGSVTTSPPDKPVLAEGYEFLQNGDYDRAEEKLNQARMREPKSPDPWYWKAQLALARENKPVALEYTDKALKLEPNHWPSLVLKIKLLLLNGGHDLVKAKEIASKSHGISEELDSWLNCLEREKVFSSSLNTDYELDAKCPPPIYKW